MNAPNPALPTRPLALKPKWIVAACLLLVVYVLLRPWLVERFGLDLPGFTDAQPKVEAPASDTATTAQSKPDKHRPIEVPVIPEQSEPVIEEPVATDPVPRVGTPATAPTVRKPKKPADSVAQSEKPVGPPTGNPPQTGNVGTGAKTTSANPPKSTTSKPPLTKPATTVATKPATPPSKATTPAKTPPVRPTTTTPPAQPQPPKLGVLTPAGRGRFESSAGLIYSQYRIEHVMEHSRDDPDKPSHSVFEGTKEEIFALIDEAYELAKKKGPPQVVIEDEGDRTTYTVNLNRKIGHGGGQSGARRRHPPLKMVKIVLEGDEVITAYPTDR